MIEKRKVSGILAVTILSALVWPVSGQETAVSPEPETLAPGPTESPEPEISSTLEPTIVSTATPRSAPRVIAPAGVTDSAVISTLDPVAVDVDPGKIANLVHLAPSASSGRASGEELMNRPFLRRGELLEVVPGMIITQHSGGGKANQYFLRGFNLDHGTDFAIFVDNMPVNNRTHGHGQGYADINFLIPELVEELEYVKGPYFSRFGDFSTAGAARFKLYRELPESIASFSIGTNNYYRGLVADSVEVGNGVATYAFEYNYYDGPWVQPDELNRWNGFVRYVVGDEDDFTSFSLMGYDSSWDATDQVPTRLIGNQTIDRLGFVDPTVGGSSSRYSVSMDFRRTGDNGVTAGSVYGGKYKLDLFSNFTLFLDDPVNGDQFNQFDDRYFLGGSIQHTIGELDYFERDNQLTFGMQTHHDFINRVGLYKTKARQRLSTVREDEVVESSIGLFTQLDTEWTDEIRTQLGVRGDLFHFDVNALSLSINSGSEWDGIISPKAGIVYAPVEDLEFYLNGGFGFHSNDARGVTITQDPLTGTPLEKVPGLVQTRGAEIGVRNNLTGGLTTTMALWYLHSDSELVYVGDAGNIEAGEASRRYGFEWSNYWEPMESVLIDTEFTLTESRFTESGDKIENAVPASFSGGISYGEETGLFGALRGRYFSPRPLNGDGSVESRDAFQLSTRVGLRTVTQWEYALEVTNLLDSDDNDIEYFYTSRLPGEPAAGVEDVHIHPYEPRQVRFTVTKKW